MATVITVLAICALLGFVAYAILRERYEAERQQMKYNKPPTAEGSIGDDATEEPM